MLHGFFSLNFQWIFVRQLYFASKRAARAAHISAQIQGSQGYVTF
jgi:hypothetical protein